MTCNRSKKQLLLQKTNMKKHMNWLWYESRSENRRLFFAEKNSRFYPLSARTRYTFINQMPRCHPTCEVWASFWHQSLRWTVPGQREGNRVQVESNWCKERIFFVCFFFQIFQLLCIWTYHQWMKDRQININWMNKWTFTDRFLIKLIKE